MEAREYLNPASVLKKGAVAEVFGDDDFCVTQSSSDLSASSVSNFLMREPQSEGKFFSVSLGSLEVNQPISLD